MIITTWFFLLCNLLGETAISSIVQEKQNECQFIWGFIKSFKQRTKSILESGRSSLGTVVSKPVPPAGRSWDMAWLRATADLLSAPLWVDQGWGRAELWGVQERTWDKCQAHSAHSISESSVSLTCELRLPEHSIYVYGSFFWQMIWKTVLSRPAFCLLHFPPNQLCTLNANSPPHFLPSLTQNTSLDLGTQLWRLHWWSHNRFKMSQGTGQRPSPLLLFGTLITITKFNHTGHDHQSLSTTCLLLTVTRAGGRDALPSRSTRCEAQRSHFTFS